jgi:hypothetical protein
MKPHFSGQKIIGNANQYNRNEEHKTPVKKSAFGLENNRRAHNSMGSVRLAADSILDRFWVRIYNSTIEY